MYDMDLQGFHIKNFVFVEKFAFVFLPLTQAE